MMSFEEIMNIVFGGQIDVSKIVTILVGVYAIVKSITEWLAKKKILLIQKDNSDLVKQIEAEHEENKKLKQSIAKFGDIILTAYLSSNTVPAEVKKELGKFGDELNKIAEIPLSETTNKIIDAVTTIVPDNSLNEHKEEIQAATKVVEDAIDDANELAKKAIDKISL